MQFHAYGGADRVHAHLVALEHPEYPQAGAVPEQLEEVGEIHGRVVVQYAGLYALVESLALADAVVAGHLSHHHLNVCSNEHMYRYLMDLMEIRPFRRRNVSLKYRTCDRADDGRRTPLRHGTQGRNIPDEDREGVRTAVGGQEGPLPCHAGPPEEDRTRVRDEGRQLPGITFTDALELLAEKYYWSRSVSNFSGKLARESLRYTEAVELADVLGYDVVWVKRDKKGGKSDDKS